MSIKPKPEIVTETIGDILSQLHAGAKVWFDREVQGYNVIARSERFIVCTKPFNPKHTVLYTIIDTKREIRGTENLVFGAGAETDEQCEEMVKRLEGRCKDTGFQTEISHRNNVPVHIRKVYYTSGARKQEIELKARSE